MIIAAAQFTARPLDVAANIGAMASLVTEAGERGAALVVFPELAVTGYELEGITADPDRLTMAPDDARLAPLRAACRAAGVAAVVNCAGRLPAGPTLSSFVYGPDGAPLTRYDKVHLTRDELAAGFAAGTADGRFTLNGVSFGLAICYDAHFPDLAARAAADGCGALLASSLYGRGPGQAERREIFPALAKDHGLHVLLANHVGAAGPYDACGGSGLWGPDGHALAEGPEEGAAALVTAEV
ncbi:carbon-nitrogen hydrolase family protein [Streptomyces griseocarneus]|uniref:carbon-nitrogen hydrolase family protein n=1 Tax=Streptomyces griseocarneus TaxID=51201 RepID=UPI00167C695C|nr:carbon-nitrogen hydrolase family protein [Streptomyces griseocarneus]MBZ6472255.1 carbon-nitrogen hydrolase family protein [Streptomyces griseocarneus]GHG72995.1 carbon-nitrogen hydrolase family protein [Streptomyces griseocarneus]